MKIVNREEFLTLEDGTFEYDQLFAVLDKKDVEIYKAKLIDLMRLMP